MIFRQATSTGLTPLLTRTTQSLRMMPRHQSLRPRGFDRQTHSERPVHHVQGDDALRVAGELARQKAIESPHRRYPRP